MKILEILAESAEKAKVEQTLKDNLPNQGGFDITLLLNVVYGVAGVVAVVYIIVAGIQYATANGDPAKASKALRMLLYALIGLVIVVVAAALTNFVFGAVGEAKQ